MRPGVVGDFDSQKISSDGVEQRRGLIALPDNGVDAALEAQGGVGNEKCRNYDRRDESFMIHGS